MSFTNGFETKTKMFMVFLQAKILDLDTIYCRMSYTNGCVC